MCTKGRAKKKLHPNEMPFCLNTKLFRMCKTVNMCVPFMVMPCERKTIHYIVTIIPFHGGSRAVRFWPPVVLAPAIRMIREQMECGFIIQTK